MFPNTLLDEVMPTLRDNEWRVLCVVVRQTLGWSGPQGERKKRDWLSQRQLMARTGRNKTALSAAVDALIRRNLITFCTQEGEPLITPAQRRGHQGRIYYGLCRPVDKKPKVSTTHTETSKSSGSRIVDLNRADAIHVDGRPSSLLIHTGWNRADQLAAARYGLTQSEQN